MESIQPPIISLDLKKKRLRIHKQTLRQLNDPPYIHFLVNPERKTIAIKVCGKHAKQAHKINYETAKDCEFYSKELLNELCTVSPRLVDGHTYRLFGKLYPDKGLAIFQMDKLTLVCEQKTGNYH